MSSFYILAFLVSQLNFCRCIQIDQIRNRASYKIALRALTVFAIMVRSRVSFPFRNTTILGNMYAQPDRQQSLLTKNCFGQGRKIVSFSVQRCAADHWTQVGLAAHTLFC